LVIAANEILTNALIHGGGAASLRVEAGEGWVSCLIADRGVGFDAASAGRRAPDPGMVPQGGMGLWIVRSLCDDVQIDLPGDGSRVTLRMKAT